MSDPVEQPEQMNEETEPTEAQVDDATTMTDSTSEAEASQTSDQEEKSLPTIEEQLRTQLQAAETKAAEARDGMLRARADYENARRRFERERDEGKKYSAEKTLKAIVPLIDDLDRALEHCGDLEGPLVDGIKLTHRKFLQVLEKEGAISFSPLGEPFDPTLHEALTEMPSETVEPGHVCQVFQRGWKLHDRLLHAAKVIVSRAP